MDQYGIIYAARIEAMKSTPPEMNKKEAFLWLKSQGNNLFDTYPSYSAFVRRIEVAEETKQIVSSFTTPVTTSFTASVTATATVAATLPTQSYDFENIEWQDKLLADKKIFKTLWFSDSHGWLCDPKATGVIFKVLQNNKFDEVGINGDLIDLPYLSKHTARLYEDGVLAGYTEIKEIEHTKASLLEPLRASTDAQIRVRLGNHDERITNPFNLGQGQSNRLNILYNHYNTTRLDEMLGISSTQGYIYDPSPRLTYFDKFDIVHGLSVTKGASRKNINDYFSSGASGHTHRLGATYVTNRNNSYTWLEMGCTRIVERAEYLPTGITPDWQQGFIELTFYREGENVFFFTEPHAIINGVCKYNGVVYKWDK